MLCLPAALWLTSPCGRPRTRRFHSRCRVTPHWMCTGGVPRQVLWQCDRMRHEEQGVTVKEKTEHLICDALPEPHAGAAALWPCEWYHDSLA